jgi:hypothetical protein
LEHKYIKISLVIVGAIAMSIFNYWYLENIIIPDPCYYHARETTPIFDIFYSISSVDGDHPVPSAFNYIFTLLIGSLFGWAIAKYLSKKI